MVLSSIGRIHESRIQEVEVGVSCLPWLPWSTRKICAFYPHYPGLCEFWGSGFQKKKKFPSGYTPRIPLNFKLSPVEWLLVTLGFLCQRPACKGTNHHFSQGSLILITSWRWGCYYTMGAGRDRFDIQGIHWGHLLLPPCPILIANEQEDMMARDSDFSWMRVWIIPVLLHWSVEVLEGDGHIKWVRREKWCKSVVSRRPAEVARTSLSTNLPLVSFPGKKKSRIWEKLFSWVEFII